MKIVHIANFYGPNSGGIKTTIHELGQRYVALGHSFYFIVPGESYALEKTEFGVKISLPSFVIPRSGAYRAIKSQALVRVVLEAINPDRLEVSDRFTMVRLGRWAKKRRIHSVAFSHETLMGLAKRYMPKFMPICTLVNWHNKRFASNFDHIITTTSFAAREFEVMQVSNIRKIPLGVDVTLFNPRHRSEELRSELLQGADYLLVHCGRLSPEKEPHRSIEALEELIASGYKARLVYLGVGPKLDELKELAGMLPVSFLGYVNNRNYLAQVLASADVTLAPGPYETFCLAALESLASGTPVVASMSSAVGELLALDREIPAGAVATNDGESFARAIESVLHDPRIRVRARLVAEALPWERTVNAMLDVA